MSETGQERKGRNESDLEMEQNIEEKRWIDEGVFRFKGQAFMLQLMFYILCSETEDDRGTMT